MTILAGARVAGAKLVRGSAAKSGSSNGVKNASLSHHAPANSNVRPSPRLVVDNTHGETVSSDFNKKYEGNSLLESRERSLRNASLQKQDTEQEETLNQTPNKGITPQTIISNKAAHIGTGLEMASILKTFSSIMFLLGFLISVHIFVITFGVIALLGFGVEIAAVDFFTWIPLVGEAAGRLAGAIVPGMEIAAIALFIAAILGWGSNLAVLLYLMAAGSWKPPQYFIFVLVFCFGAYVIPGIQLFPWFSVIALVAFIDTVLKALKKS